MKYEKLICLVQIEQNCYLKIKKGKRGSGRGLAGVNFWLLTYFSALE